MGNDRWPALPGPNRFSTDRNDNVPDVLSASTMCCTVDSAPNGTTGCHWMKPLGPLTRCDAEEAFVEDSQRQMVEQPRRRGWRGRDGVHAERVRVGATAGRQCIARRE